MLRDVMMYFCLCCGRPLTPGIRKIGQAFYVHSFYHVFKRSKPIKTTQNKNEKGKSFKQKTTKPNFGKKKNEKFSNKKLQNKILKKKKISQKLKQTKKNIVQSNKKKTFVSDNNIELPYLCNFLGRLQGGIFLQYPFPSASFVKNMYSIIN